jgi:hypothetical protein
LQNCVDSGSEYQDSRELICCLRDIRGIERFDGFQVHIDHSVRQISS